MLSSLIYRSQIQQNIDQEMMMKMVEDGNYSNQKNQISGLLFYDAPFLFQILEGSQASIKPLFEKILQDPRHSNVVLLADETIKARQYPKLGMHFVDLEKIKSIDMSLVQYREENNLSPVNNNFDSKIEKFICQFTEYKYKNKLRHAIANGLEQFSYPIPQQDSDSIAIPPNGHSFAFQAVVDFRKRKTMFVEALARGPEGQCAEEFFSGMNQDEFAHYDMHSTEDAISLAAQLGIEKLSVNFSPNTIFKSIDIVDKLGAMLARHGFNPSQLVVEVTETDFIENHQLAPNIIAKLRASGVELAIDDFGAGYAGLSLLAQFQPDILKIDGGLIRSISSNGPKQSIVRAIYDCADSLAISVVAEGVECDKDLQFLTSIGITQFQGHLFNTPKINSYTGHYW
jgi:EAL domain-containing protein (putative c-di-GMP-specific phosphodiesterase class I)